jgi:hypothetical protein
MVLTAAWMSPVEIDKVAITNVKYSSNAATLEPERNDEIKRLSL